MKKIYNPTENDVNITIGGIAYSVKAGESTDEKEEVVEKWIATHQFLQVKEVEVVVEKKEEVKEEKTSGDKPRDILKKEEKEYPKEENKESFIKRAVKAASKK